VPPTPTASTEKSLLALTPGLTAKVLRVRGEFRQRLLEMGFVRGTAVRMVKAAPLADPLEFVLRGYHVALRREEAATVLIEPISDPGH